MRDLLLVDPETEKIRIEQTKGGLLEGSFRWILKDQDFRRWHDDDQKRLLWIKGDAGKGKTMLLIGLIDEFSRQNDGPERRKTSFELFRSISSTGGKTLSYFFCQSTDSRLNHATAVLRGLIYSLVLKHRPLISHVRMKYDHEQKELFESGNALYSLSEILRHIIQDKRLPPTYLMIDALDECNNGLPQLLYLIAQTASEPFSRVKWIVSSRHRQDIEQTLGLKDSHTGLSLELNADHVSRAVNVFIDHKVSQLHLLRDDKPLRKKKIRDELCEKAGGTFLWVALAIQGLEDSEVLAADMLKVLKETPEGLIPLYSRMMGRIEKLRG